MSQTVAERLIDIDKEFRFPKDSLIEADGPMPEVMIPRIRLAMNLRQRGPVVSLRAIIEDWTLERIVREVY